MQRNLKDWEAEVEKYYGREKQPEVIQKIRSEAQNDLHAGFLLKYNHFYEKALMIFESLRVRLDALSVSNISHLSIPENMVLFDSLFDNTLAVLEKETKILYMDFERKFLEKPLKMTTTKKKLEENTKPSKVLPLSVHTLKLKTGIENVSSVHVLKDESGLAVAYSDREDYSLKIYSFQYKEVIATIPKFHESAITAIETSLEPLTIYTGDESGQLVIQQFQSGKFETLTNLTVAGAIDRMVYLASKKLLFVAGKFDYLGKIDLNSPDQKFTVEPIKLSEGEDTLLITKDFLIDEQQEIIMLIIQETFEYKVRCLDLENLSIKTSFNIENGNERIFQFKSGNTIGLVNLYDGVITIMKLNTLANEWMVSARIEAQMTGLDCCYVTLDEKHLVVFEQLVEGEMLDKIKSTASVYSTQTWKCVKTTIIAGERLYPFVFYISKNDTALLWDAAGQADSYSSQYLLSLNKQ